MGAGSKAAGTWSWPHAFRVCIVLFLCTRSVRCIYRTLPLPILYRHATSAVWMSHRAFLRFWVKVASCGWRHYDHSKRRHNVSNFSSSRPTCTTAMTANPVPLIFWSQPSACRSTDTHFKFSTNCNVLCHNCQQQHFCTQNWDCGSIFDISWKSCNRGCTNPMSVGVPVCRSSVWSWRTALSSGLLRSV